MRLRLQIALLNQFRLCWPGYQQQALGDGVGCHGVVPGDHVHLHTRLMTVLDRTSHSGPRRVDHGDIPFFLNKYL